jgi:hypothetical protein
MLQQSSPRGNSEGLDKRPRGGIFVLATSSTASPPRPVQAPASRWALWWSRNQAAAGSSALLFDPSASESFVVLHQRPQGRGCRLLSVLLVRSVGIPEPCHCGSRQPWTICELFIRWLRHARIRDWVHEDLITLSLAARRFDYLCSESRPWVGVFQEGRGLIVEIRVTTPPTLSA